MTALTIPILAVFLGADNSATRAPSSASPQSALLNQGYAQMYDLQFDTAHKIFADYERKNPRDPVAPASDAAAYLFSEFDRLHILQSEFFLHDENFTRTSKLAPDPAARRLFNSMLDRAQKLASASLSNNPRDANALFASILVQGLRADYDALIEKRYLSSLSSVKGSRITAERLLSIDPTYYDAHVAVGVENYLLSLKPAPLRWFLQLGGAQTDREQGIQRLQITAEKGNYLKPYARLLLAVAALRAHNRGKARKYLEELSRQFPHNPLYTEELARLN